MSQARDYEYLITRNSKTGNYSVCFNGVEVARELELAEAVAMIETLMRGDKYGE